MKKTYTTPETFVKEARVSTLLAASINVSNDSQNGIQGDTKTSIFDTWEEDEE